MRVPVLLRALLVALFSLPGLLIIPRLSHAAEWSAEPSVRASREYNDNISMTVQPHNTVSGSVTAPKIFLGVLSDNWQLNGSAEYERKNYSGENYLDTNNQYFNLGSSYRTERSTWQLNGSLVKTSTLTNDWTTSPSFYIRGVNIFGQTVTSPVYGAVQTHRLQETRNISPSWLWSMDERNQLQLSYQYTDIAYVDGSSVGLSDNTTRGVTARLVNQVSAIDQVFVSGSYSIFRTPEVTHASVSNVYSLVAFYFNPILLATESRSTAYHAGITHNFSDTTKGNLSLGVQQTTTEQFSQTCTSKNSAYVISPLDYPNFGPPCLAPPLYATETKVNSIALYNGGLETQLENTHVSVNYSRTINPGSTGDQVQTDSLSLGVTRSVTDRLTGNLSINASKYNSETRSVTGYNYTLYQIEPSISWRWTQELNVDIAYRYAHIRRSWESEPAISHFASLGLRYQWPKILFSR